MSEEQSNWAIETRGLVRRFGDTLAVDNLELRISRGAFFGLLGRNGAGKSTTIALLTGLLRPTTGSILLFGKAVAAGDAQAKSRLGVVTEEPSLFARMRGREQLTFVGQMYGLRAMVAAARADVLLDLLELRHAAESLIVDYSRGMRKKLAIACALIHGPDLFFFDEPFEGIDAVSALVVERVLRGLTAAGCTVVLTTHILDVAQRLCQRVAIIDGGRLKTEFSLADEDRRSLADRFRRAVGAAHEDHAALPAWLGGPAT
jgi:ABC-2 type transport system ATP-binding protein